MFLGLLVLLVMLVAGCTSGSPDSRLVEPPISVKTDSVVVPGELASEFAFLNANLSSDVYTDPNQVSNWSLERHRALGYVFTSGMRPEDWSHHEIELITFTGVENSRDELISDLAQRLGFEIVEEIFLEGPSLYTISSPRELTLGEAAWYIDWMISNYSTEIMYANPSMLLSH
jgi:hypothetical protein